MRRWKNIWVGLLVTSCAREPIATWGTSGGSQGDTSTGENVTGTTSTTGDDTTEQSTSSSATSGDETAGSDPFVVEPDLPVVCTNYDDTCPEGQKCNAYSGDGSNDWNAFGCFPITGDGMHGDPCTIVGDRYSGRDDCAKGHICWLFEKDTKMGECVAWCVGSEFSAMCDDPWLSCYIWSHEFLALCISACDPLAQNCEDGRGCYPTHDEKFTCQSSHPVEGLEGDPCLLHSNCQLGYMCNRSEGHGCEPEEGCCAPYCDLNQPDCPNPQTACTPVHEPALPWLDHIGVCRPQA